MSVAVVLVVVKRLDLVDQVIKSERVGSLDRETKSSAPDLGGHHTEGSGYTEEHSVVVELVQAVVHEESTRAGINVGPGVAYLASGLKNVRDYLVDGLNKVDEVVVLNVLLSKVELAHKARIGLSQDGVTVSWDNLALLESILHILFNVLRSPVFAEAVLELKQPFQAFLVSEAVERAGKTVHTCGERKVRIGKGATNEVSGVGANVATFVITIE